MKRRTFIKTALQGTAAACSVTAALGQGDNVRGANERVNVALIGCGTRGMAVARLMREVPNVAFVAVCDVYETNANRARQWAGRDCQAYGDFRKVLDRKDVDAVL